MSQHVCDECGEHAVKHQLMGYSICKNTSKNGFNKNEL